MTDIYLCCFPCAQIRAAADPDFNMEWAQTGRPPPPEQAEGIVVSPRIGESRTFPDYSYLDSCDDCGVTLIVAASSRWLLEGGETWQRKNGSSRK